MLKFLWLLFIAFLKVGTFGYGGGPSMIPLLQQEVVEANQWMSEEEFIDALAMGNTLPGPIMIKMSVYIGYRLAKVPGAFVALLGGVLPAIVLMSLFTLVYLKVKDHPKVNAALRAARPAVIGLLVWTAYDLGSKVLASERGGWSGVLSKWDGYLLVAGAFVAVTFLKVHPALVILAAAIIGFAVY